MNHRAPANGRYKPTCYEHAANCYTHAFLIVPAIVGSALLHRLSDDCWEKITAWIYGMGLCALFIVSTVFHIVSWKKSHLRTVEHCFHMCDRMVIYFFIAASYAPWLNLRELGPLAAHMRWFIWLMAAGGTIYVFLYHEKYKVVELFFYLTMGFSPALVVTSMAPGVLEKGGSLFLREERSSVGIWSPHTEQVPPLYKWGINHCQPTFRAAGASRLQDNRCRKLSTIGGFEETHWDGFSTRGCCPAPSAEAPHAWPLFVEILVARAAVSAQLPQKRREGRRGALCNPRALFQGQLPRVGHTGNQIQKEERWQQKNKEGKNRRKAN
ncbi:PREDICTED: monocyte to macrophage differentiation factor [Chinchilla lanigera]|uniref:monocyte to macrophage differentiation factor n=1 Tax=Chinchilla lanigera TaxID=34839 RepID=UPI00038EE6BB|nr:PREDICTED: monocyte to macrophage differentiation factor [Chinchilla lanigera]XP_013374760.1 PREDICTED: monocyte to macrophage differentiation factor [Chinchilla lanigera]XP_013374761.1 PREDICTED: monocyte to macrophage differentiation factor [Chinchilla lanigera]